MNKNAYCIAILALFAILSQAEHVYATTENNSVVEQQEQPQTQDSPKDKCDSVCNATLRGARDFCEVGFPSQQGGPSPDPNIFQFNREDCDRVVFHEWWEDPMPDAPNSYSRVCDPQCTADPSYRVLNDQRFQERVIKRLNDEKQRQKDKVRQYDNAYPNGPELPYLHWGRDSIYGPLPLEEMIGKYIAKAEKNY